MYSTRISGHPETDLVRMNVHPEVAGPFVNRALLEGARGWIGTQPGVRFDGGREVGISMHARECHVRAGSCSPHIRQ